MPRVGGNVIRCRAILDSESRSSPIPYYDATLASRILLLPDVEGGEPCDEAPVDIASVERLYDERGGG